MCMVIRCSILIQQVSLCSGPHWGFSLAGAVIGAAVGGYYGGWEGAARGALIGGAIGLGLGLIAASMLGLLAEVTLLGGVISIPLVPEFTIGTAIGTAVILAALWSQLGSVFEIFDRLAIIAKLGDAVLVESVETGATQRIIGALEAIETRNLPTGAQLVDKNVSQLIDSLKNGSIQVKADHDVSMGGLHFLYDQGTLYINPLVLNRTDIGLALVVYAEYQHDSSAPDYYPTDNDEVQEAFDRVRTVLTDSELTPFVRSLNHGHGR